LFEYK